MCIYIVKWPVTLQNTLIDVWRDRNLDFSQFSCVKPNGSLDSIDLWLAAPEIARYISDVSISSVF